MASGSPLARAMSSSRVGRSTAFHTETKCLSFPKDLNSYLTKSEKKLKKVLC